ncbi:MAG: type II secretion system GspH family protein [Gemmatimonadota bacterium]|nr:type II secretion system GspH family protein [Gemmatimonadota bacterium]
MTAPARAPRVRGFTLIELLVVMTVLGILAGITVPVLRGAIERADAVKVVSDVHTIRMAVLQYVSQESALPGTAGWGEVPPEIADILPDGFAFGYKRLEYAWTRIPSAGGTGSTPSQRVSPGRGRGQGLTRRQQGGGGASETQEVTGIQGVIWVRYDSQDPVANALKRHAGHNAAWTPDQMMFVVAQ